MESAADGSPLLARNLPTLYGLRYGEIKWKFTMVYIDDIIIFSKTWKEHLEHIKTVLSKLEKKGIYIKPSKCEFGVEKMNFLGFDIFANGVEADEKKNRSN